MPYEKIEIHPFNFKSRLKKFKTQVPNKKSYDEILSFLQCLSRGEITGKIVGEKRQRKLLDMFILFFKNCNKSLSQLTLKDLQDLKDKLLNDTIKKQNGGNYSLKTKEDLTETIIRFLEWNNPNKLNELASKRLPLRKWFMIKAKRKTPETLSEAEVEKLYKNCKSLEGKFLIAVLFDSGARIEEFLNIRFEDIEEPTTNFPYYKIDFKEEYSKTEGRKIGLYWKYCTEAIAKYLGACEKKDMKDRVFDKNYDAVRMYLARLGKRILNKRVHPHLFRKSSATYYASKLNRQQFCIKYGWKFSSDMPDIYIRRAGVEEDKVKDLMLNDDISVLRSEISYMKLKQKEQSKKIKLLEIINKKMKKIQKFDKERNIKDVSNVLKMVFGEK